MLSAPALAMPALKLPLCKTQTRQRARTHTVNYAFAYSHTWGVCMFISGGVEARLVFTGTRSVDAVWLMSNVNHFIHNRSEVQCTSISCLPKNPCVVRARNILLSDALSNIKWRWKQLFVLEGLKSDGILPGETYIQPRR